jgi:hypothetical protein
MGSFAIDLPARLDHERLDRGDLEIKPGWLRSRVLLFQAFRVGRLRSLDRTDTGPLLPIAPMTPGFSPALLFRRS